MGLDGVEFIMEVEDALQVAIPDAAASEMRTPRNLVDYLRARLTADREQVCLEQRAFHRLRAAAMRVFDVSRADVTPQAGWDSLLPNNERRHYWRLLGQSAAIVPWPKLTLWGGFRSGLATVGESSRHAARHAPGSLRHASEGWTLDELQAVVARLMDESLGIRNFGWEQEFVRDLGVD